MQGLFKERKQGNQKSVNMKEAEAMLPKCIVEEIQI